MQTGVRAEPTFVLVENESSLGPSELLDLRTSIERCGFFPIDL